MKNTRRIIQQIHPERTQSFDQHFWPVLVALCVLSGIAVGAILTMLRGPWMWGSLLLLPALAAFSIFLLFKLDDAKLRRSLQLAIIVSLAVHLLILLVASVTSIFENNYRQPKRQIAKRDNKTIKITNQRIPQFWQQPDQTETPDPEIQTERQETLAATKPQPVPVEQKLESVKPQVTRRTTPSETVPRQNKQLSELRRQTRNLAPQSTVQTQVQPAAKPQSAKSNPTETKVAASRQPAVSTTTKAATQSQTTEAPAEANQSIVSKRNTQARPESMTSKLDPATESAARIRRTSPSMPVSNPGKSLPEVAVKPKQSERAEQQASQSANQITRRPDVATLARPNQQSQPDTQLSTNSQVARAAIRRTQPTEAGISNPQSTTTLARRSNLNSPTATTTTVLEAPSRAPDSQQHTLQLNAKTLSISKAENGIAGMGVSRNLDRDVGGTPSPAMRASDSAARRQTESRPVPEQMLTASQDSQSRRSVAQTRVPTSAFKADTKLNAKISGAKHPTQQSSESSAATVDAASAEYRSQVAAEKGQANVDLGPTKIVADQSARRRSGGGQTEVSRINPESTRLSNQRSSERLPTLAESSIAQTAAPMTADSRPLASDTPQPNAVSLAMERDGGESSSTKQESTATELGDPLDQGSSRLSELLADARQKADRDQLLDANNSDDEDEQAGDQDTHLAQAPLVRKATDLGDARVARGVRDSESTFAAESVTSTIVERATGTIAGSLTASTARQLLGAAAGLPLVDPGPRSPSATRAGRLPRESADDALAGSENETRYRSNDQAPRIVPSAAESFAINNGESRSEVVMEAPDIVVDRSANETRQAGAALEVVAPEGPAGLGEIVSIDLGIRKRPASKDSLQIQLDNETRFRDEKFGSSPAVSPNAIMAKEAFRSRKPAAAAGAEPTNERAVQLGLEFLARNQSTDGSWSLSGFDRDRPQYKNQLNSDSAATGLALLAFQGAGYNHREFKYARQLDHAIDWLLENQDRDGCLFVESGTRSDKSCRLYSHAIAALALTEAFGMTQDPELREPAQKALDYIVETQDPNRGGWRYYAQPNLRQTDTSVTGWMMMALQSGRLAGLDVPKSTFKGIDSWLKVSAEPSDPSQFRYNPYATDSSQVDRSQGRRASPPMTAVGLLMQIYSGWDRDDPRLIKGAQSLVDRQMPSDENVLLRDTYYWYYATQVLLHVDGPLWEQWESQLHPLLIKSQVPSGEMSGSWDPYSPVPDRWGIHAGRLYVTTMNLLSLEVKTRKLPLYDDTLKGQEH